MIDAESRTGSQRCSAQSRSLSGTNRKRCRPTVGGFLIDEESPGEPFAAGQRQRTKVDSEWNPQFAPWRDSRGSASLELPVQTYRLVTDHDCVSVFVGQVETPLVFDVCLVPRHTDSHSHGDLLRTRSDDSQATTKNEQLSVIHLHGVGHQDDRSKCWRVEDEVRLIHRTDPIGLDLSTEARP